MRAFVCLGLITGIGVANAQQPAPAAPAAASQAIQPLSVPVPPAGTLVAITNATILTASHGTIEGGTILIRNGKIAVKDSYRKQRIR